MEFVTLMNLDSLATFARLSNENALSALFACAFNMEIR